MKVAAQQELMNDGPVVVGIIGGSGSGKSWLARELAQALGPEHAGVICQDSFYRDLSHLTPAQRREVNFDHPNALDWPAFRKTLLHAASGRAARVPQYNFNTHTREAGEVVLEPRRVVIFEGLWLLHKPALRRFYQLAVFLDASPELCLGRRLERDTRERGRAAAEVNAWYAERVLPMQRKHVNPQSARADLIWPGPADGAVAAKLAEKISKMLGGK